MSRGDKPFFHRGHSGSLWTWDDEELPRRVSHCDVCRKDYSTAVESCPRCRERKKERFERLPKKRETRA